MLHSVKLMSNSFNRVNFTIYIHCSTYHKHSASSSDGGCFNTFFMRLWLHVLVHHRSQLGQVCVWTFNLKTAFCSDLLLDHTIKNNNKGRLSMAIHVLGIMCYVLGTFFIEWWGSILCMQSLLFSRLFSPKLIFSLVNFMFSSLSLISEWYRLHITVKIHATD